jgi:Zn-dependent metalloprotease
MFACSENAAADSLAELLRRTSARTGNQLGGIQGAQVETNAAVSVPGLDVALAGFLDQLRRSTETNEVSKAQVLPSSPPSVSTAAVSQPWIVTPAANGTARQIRRASAVAPSGGGRIALSAVVDPARHVRSFLAEQATELGLNEPEVELELVSTETDGLGYQHFRFRQRFGGLPVWPTGLTVHLAPDGDPHLLDAAIIRTPSGVDIVPAIPSETAVERAKARVPGGFAGTASTPELIVYAPLEEAPVLAWKFRIRPSWFQSWTALVDAKSSAILRLQSDVRDAQAVGSGLDMFGKQRTFPVWSANGGYYLMDTTKPSFRPEFNPVTDPQGVIAIGDLLNQEFGAMPPQAVFSSDRNAWSSRDAVSALVGLGVTYDYFLTVHQRNGLGGDGGNLLAIVRSGGLDNAFYLNEQRVMVFGDVQPFVASLDVVAHELAHGVTANSANLEYRNQSGALNESFSDIFGELVEHYAYGTHDWRMGSALSRQLRDFKSPGSIVTGFGPNPSKWSEYLRLNEDQDYGGVHINSSIINHAFYQLAAGLPNHLSLQDAAAVFYRCLTVHLQPQSQFIDCRLGCIASAEELFPHDPSKAAAVADAFDVVEILDLPPSPPPGQLQPVDAPDSVLAVYHNAALTRYSLARREAAKGDNPVAGKTVLLGVKKSRISVTGNGSAFAVVDEDGDLCSSTTDAPSTALECYGLDGFIHSAAISANAGILAAVLKDPITSQPRDRLIVTDGKLTREYRLKSPAIDGVAVDSILSADQLSFSPDGRYLLYDALSEVRFGNGPKVERWSIYLLDLQAELVWVVVPPLADFNIGNPVFGHTSDRFIAFEGQRIGTGASAVLTYDRSTGSVGGIAVVDGGYGYPEFTGDDRALVFANSDESAALTRMSLFRQGLAEDRITKAGTAEMWLRDAVLGVVYRRGTYRSVNERPTVSLVTQPAVSAVTVGTTVTLNAFAFDPEGQLAKVEFWSGGTRIAVDTVAPFSVTIPAIGAGSFNFVARAVDAFGMASDSLPIRMVATLPLKRLALRLQENGTILLEVEAPQGNYLIERSVDLKSWSGIQNVNIGASGKETFIYQPATDGSHAFLRLK